MELPFTPLKLKEHHVSKFEQPNLDLRDIRALPFHPLDRVFPV